MAAPKSFQQDTLSRITQMGNDLIELQADLTKLIELSVEHNSTSFSNQELSEVSGLDHLNASKVSGAITALTAIRDAIAANRAAFIKVIR